jgi:glycosyltransferase involved in cell wall biosynthesis
MTATPLLARFDPKECESESPVGWALAGGKMIATDRRYKIFCIGSFMNSAGAQEALVRVAKQLRSRGHETQVRFLYKKKRVFADDPGVLAVSDKPELSFLGYIDVFWKLVQELRGERPDAVICFMPLGTVIGSLAAVLAGVPVRIASQRAPGPTFGRAMRILDRLWGSSFLYTKIVCVSDAVQKSFSSYSRRYQDKTLVVHNGISWTPSRLSRLEARAKFGLPGDKILFVAAGRLSYQKYYQFLLARIRDVSQAHLVIAGDGEDRAELEAFIEAHALKSRVFLLGAISQADVVDLYAAADIFIQTSRYEGQSNATLEAMHAGLPILVSDIEMQRETLCTSDGTCVGMLASLDDPADWNKKMEQLISSEALRASLGEAARIYVEQRFSLKAMIDGFEGLVLEACK